MKKIQLMLIKDCGLVFFLALAFFVFILELIDIFAYLWQYIDRQVAITDIVMISVLYLPKCISYAMPVALLFAISFSLGNLYANNELIGVLGAGMSFFALIVPLLCAGLILSGLVFGFEEGVVIQSLKAKTELQNKVLQRNTIARNIAEIGFIDRQTDIYLKVDNFISQENALIGLLLFERQIPRIIYAERAEWKENVWVLPLCYVYEYNPTRTFLQGRRELNYKATQIRQSPEKFRLTTNKIEEMDLTAAATWIEELRSAGLPAQLAETGFYNKFSYALRIFIVTIIAASIGNAFRKNILLMCLLSSLVLSVVFFVFQLITDAFAKNGFLNPIWGAFLPIILFAGVGTVFLVRART